MLMNPAAPNIYLDDNAAEAYKRFRFLIIHQLPKLEFFDSTEVTTEERTEAGRVGKFMKVAKPKGGSTDVNEKEEVGVAGQCRLVEGRVCACALHTSPPTS